MAFPGFGAGVVMVDSAHITLWEGTPMQCPACNHEAPQAEFGDPLKCPSCGAFYAKALAAKQKAAAALEVAPAADVVKQARQIKGASLPVAAQPVVVVDIQMRFWSMVVFMVKWVFASIPAFIIVAVICAVVWGITLGLLGGASNSLVSSSLPPTSNRVAAEPAAVPVIRPISATIRDKGFLSRADGHDQDQMAFGLTFRNNTGREVNAFDGTAVFTDVLGNEVFRAAVVVDGYFPVDGEINRGFTVRYNKFMSDHVRFNDMDQSRLFVDFRPKKALFKGGEIQEF
ncbi:MAG TPA: hypothetical protein VGE28_12355 [Pseudomonas sp.]